MSSLNRAQLIGNLGADPDVRHTQSGDLIVNLRIATSERWKDKNTGEQRERTEWHSVSLFGGLAKVAEQYLSKGDKIYVEGQLQTRKWQDQDGKDRYSTSVNCSGFGGKLIMLGGGSGGSSAGRQEEPKSLGQQLDDEIPF